jgi:hypothetical protein
MRFRISAESLSHDDPVHQVQIVSGRPDATALPRIGSIDQARNWADWPIAKSSETTARIGLALIWILPITVPELVLSLMIFDRKNRAQRRDRC